MARSTVLEFGALEMCVNTQPLQLLSDCAFIYYTRHKFMAA